jgi:serine/threonine protein phosphatase 1
MSIIILGDIHGCKDELEDLLDIVQPSSRDMLVSVGDVIHKGPDSVGVIRRLRELKAVLVLGNHEEKQARYRNALKAAPDRAAGMKGAEEMEQIEGALDDADRAWLETALPYMAALPRLPSPETALLFPPKTNPEILIVHAGVLPEMTHLPLFSEFEAMKRAEREKFLRILRVRYITGRPQTKLTVEFTFPFAVGDEQEDGSVQLTDGAVGDALRDGGWTDYAVVKSSTQAKGSFISLGEETSRDWYWAEKYDGRFGHIYFGHEPWLPGMDRKVGVECEGDDNEPALFQHATGLDLGCVFGGRLAAAVLSEDGTREYFSVPARKKYATGLWEE